MVLLLGGGAGQSVAIGSSALALRNQSIAIGADSLALGDQSTALGANSRATGAASVAIGGDDIDSARGNNAVYKALTGVDLPSGYISTQSSGDASTAVGVQAKASGHYGTAIGMASAATGNLSVGIGSKATASSDATTAIGVNSSASKKYASAIGLNSTASGEYATSIGSGGNTVSKATQATADGALALGGNANAGAQASNINATAIGGESVASGVSAIALGTQAEALATNSLAFGRKAQVTNTNATGAMAIGSQLDWAFDAADGGTQTVNTKADGRNSLALGNGAQSNSENSMALGNVANATGNQAIALGTYNKANGLSSLSIGHRSNANADYALAQGYKALASGVSSISVGNQANALATNTVAIGRGASSKFNDNIAIGTNAVADTGSNTIGSSIAMGANAYTLGMYQTAVGTGARATTNQAAALGYKAGAAGSGSAAVGTGTASLGTGSTVVSAGAASNDLKGLAAGVPMGSGFRSVTMSTAYTGPTQTSIAGSFSNNSRLPTNFTFTLDGTTGAVTGGTLGTKTLNKEQALAVYNALSMGSAIATEDNSTAVGYSSLASGAAATALGGGASALGANAVAVGRAEGVGANAVAVGYASQALGSESTAVGKNTVASASNTLAIGSGGTDANSTKTTASAVGAIAIGGNTTAGARALGTDSIALGGESIAGSTSKANAVAIGKGAKATGQNAISIGTGNTVSGDNSGAIGDPTTITGSGTYTVGNNNGTVDASESGIMGNNNTITTGLGITDTRVIGNKNTINSTKVMVLGNGVTVGANLDGAVVLGDGSTVTSATPTANATVTGTAANAKAINYGTFAGATPDTGDVVSVGAVGNERQIINVAAGEIASGSTDAINGSQLYATQAVISNLAGSTAAALGGGASVNSANGAILAPTYSLTNNPNAGTKTTSNNVGGALTTLDTAVNQPITFKDAATGTSVQKLGSTFAIVGDGKNLSTVVTAGQAKISMSDTPIFTNVTADQVTVKNAPTAGTDATNKTYVDGQVQSVANNPLTFAGDTGTNVQRKLGETTKIVGGITDPTKLSANNIGVVADGTDKLTIQLAKDLTGLNSVESNTIKLGDAINNTTLTSTANGLNVGGDKITNVGKGDVSATSTDAINGSQLNTAQNSTSSIIGGGVTNNAGSLTGPFTTNGNSYSNIAEAIEDQAKKSKTTVTQGDNIVVTSGTNADGSVNYEVATAKDVNFDKVTVGNVVTDGATGKISGLTAGDVSSTSTEAINGSQLNAQGEGVKNIIGGSTVYDPTTGTLTNTNIGGTGESTIDDAIKNVNTAATKAKTTVTQGDNIVVTSGTNADGSVNYEVATAKDVNFDKVTVGNVVTDGATGKISGLTDGTVAAGSTEAVTGNQLNAQGEGVKNIIGGSTVYDPTTGTLTNTNIGGTGESTIDDAIKNVNTAATKAKTTVTQGDNIVVTSGTNADGSVNYEVATAKDVNFDKVTVGNVVTDGATGKISGLTAGDVSSTSTEAINGSQLNT
ncbi:beta strand repeat-containing protein, partial [Acinetobacter sp. YH12207]